MGPGYKKCPLGPEFCIWLLCCVSSSKFQRCLADPQGVVVYSLRTCSCVSGGAGDRRQSYLTGDGCDENGHLLYR